MRSPLLREEGVAVDNSVRCASLWPEAVGMGVSKHLRYWLEGQEIEGLHGSVLHGRNREWPLSTIALRDIHAPEWLRLVASWLQVAYGSCFLLRRVPDDLVHAWGFLALVFRHSSHGKGFAAERVG